MRVAIIGGGAAGFFAAIAVAENYPTAEVVIIEKNKKIFIKSQNIWWRKMQCMQWRKINFKTSQSLSTRK